MSDTPNVPADDIQPHSKQFRIIGWGSAGAVAAAIAVWFVMEFVPGSIADAHASEHTMDQQQLEQVSLIAANNAVYINNQLLAQLYLRAGRLREAVQEDPNDGNAREALARAEVEIRRREAELAP